MSKKRFSSEINIKNRKASYEYEFLDEYLAGIVLQGTEIKSIREGKVSLKESYCYFARGELFIKNLHISPYAQGNIYNHEPDRERKLLLKRSELRKLEAAMNEKGLTIIAKRLFINSRGLAKLNIALAKGKKIYDKRQSIKEKDMKREMDRIRY